MFECLHFVPRKLKLEKHVPALFKNQKYMSRYLQVNKNTTWESVTALLHLRGWLDCTSNFERGQAALARVNLASSKYGSKHVYPSVHTKIGVRWGSMDVYPVKIWYNGF